MVEILEIVKELAGEIVIVVLFLHYLRVRDKTYSEHLRSREETYDKRLANMTQLFTDTAKEGHEIAGKLSEALGDLRTEGHDVAGKLREAFNDLRMEIARSNSMKVK